MTHTGTELSDRHQHRAYPALTAASQPHMDFHAAAGPRGVQGRVRHGVTAGCNCRKAATLYTSFWPPRAVSACLCQYSTKRMRVLERKCELESVCLLSVYPTNLLRLFFSCNCIR